VTRQHVQGLVAALVKRGLCVLLPNPGHVRSPLVSLTGKGRAVVETIRECEHAALGEISSQLPGDVTTALAVLRRLNAALVRRA
jgi:DNA-binding MarR family transcriptional regulator